MSQKQLKPVVKISMFEQFVKKSIKVDLFNLTYHDEVFGDMLRSFIPRSDFFIKPVAPPIDNNKGAGQSPIVAVADDGSVYAAPIKRENRKKRKSMKLEFLTSLLDAMMAAIVQFSSKIHEKHRRELDEVQELVRSDQDRFKRKLERLRQTVASLEAKKSDESRGRESLEAEWSNLARRKNEMKEMLDKLMLEKDQHEKDMIEFKAQK